MDKFEAELQRQEIEDMDNRLDRYESALCRIVSWSEAYPLDVFPELTTEDWRKVQEALKGTGISLDRVASSNMRHVVEGVGEIAREALDDPKD